ncbi:hypothetical protein D9M69_358010 [compost metagenome]
MGQTIRDDELYVAYGMTREANWLDSDPCYEALGATEGECWRQYAEFVRNGMPADELKLICEALQRNQLTGTRFVDEVERIVRGRIERRGQG